MQRPEKWIKSSNYTRNDGVCLWSQHWGGWGQEIWVPHQSELQETLFQNNKEFRVRLGIWLSWQSAYLACLVWYGFDPQHHINQVEWHTHTWNPSLWEVKTGESEIQGHPRLPSEFEVSLKYMRLRQKKKNNNKNWITWRYEDEMVNW